MIKDPTTRVNRLECFYYDRDHTDSDALSLFSFFTALHGMQTRSSDENNSVRPSVRLSVRQTCGL